MNSDDHRSVREMLGALVLGHLTPAEETAIRAHLDGCPDCRRDLAEISPLAHELATVDLDRVYAAPTPSPDLGHRIQVAVTRERLRRDQLARRRHMLLAAAAVLAVLLVGGVGLKIGQEISGPPVATVPIESVEVRPKLAGVQARAGVVAHTWGVEIKLEATGLRSGRPYAVVVTTRDGRTRSAGAFVGTGDNVINCNLNSDVLRPDATGFRVLDEDGQAVLTADL